jgi:dTDP-4-dehydrorhamnose reductase
VGPGPPLSATKVLVTGASGFIGREFLRGFGERATGTCFRHARPGLIAVDLRDRAALRSLLADLAPGAVVHCAARPGVDWCEENPDEARALNAAPAIDLAEACAESGARLVFLSTDYVFDGAAGPYGESAAPCPINVYGRLKLEAEEGIRARLPGGHLIVRTTNVYGYDVESKNFLMALLPQLARGERVKVAADQWGTPTLVADLCRVTRELLESGATGTVHVTGPDYVNRVQWARAFAEAFGFDPALLVGAATEELGQAARRPLRAGLVSERLGSAVAAPPRALAEGLASMRHEWDRGRAPASP